MGNRLTRREQQAANRRALLRAAERVIARCGLERASLSDIAAEAGLTKGAVYSSFSGKADLIGQVIADRADDEHARRLRAVLERPDRSPQEAIEAWSREWLAIADSGERRDYVRTLIDYMLAAQRDPAIAAEVGERLRASAQGQGAAAGAMIPASSALAEVGAADFARIISALDFGLAVLELADPGHSRLELMAVAVRLMAGLPGRPDEGA